MLVNIDRITNTNLADYYFRKDVFDIEATGYKDINPRPKYSDGTPAFTYSVNQSLRTYDINNGEYPIMTLRYQAWKSAIKEMLWIYLDGSNDLNVLRDKYGVKYWDDWDIGDGTIGHRYGYTFNKHYNFKEFIKNLKEDPFSRRHIIDLWQVSDFNETDGLVPCAFLTMWNVRRVERNYDDDEYFIDMTLVQRSGDMCAASGAGGINEIQYYALMLMVCKFTGYKPGKFLHLVQNEQIYDRHVDNARKLANRKSVGIYNLEFNCSEKEIEELNFDNISINNFSMVGNGDYYWEVSRENPQLKFDLGI